MPLSAAAAGAGGRRLAVGVELSAAQAYPGDTLLLPEEAAAGDGLQVLHEPPGMLPVRLPDAAEGRGDAGLPLLLGDAGISGAAFVPDGVLICRGGAEKVKGLMGQGRHILRGSDVAAATGQQPLQDGGVLCLLGGGEAEGVGDDMKAVLIQGAGCVQIKLAGAALIPEGGLQTGKRAAFAQRNDRRGGLDG